MDSILKVDQLSKAEPNANWGSVDNEHGAEKESKNGPKGEFVHQIQIHKCDEHNGGKNDKCRKHVLNGNPICKTLQRL